MISEYSVVGSILLNPSCLQRVREIIQPDDFVNDTLRKMYSTLCCLSDEGTPLDHTVLIQRLAAVKIL